MSTPDLDERDTFIRRTLVGASLAGAAGTAALLVWDRAGWAIAFGVGAAVSLGNFHLIARTVSHLAEPNALQASRHLWKGALFRFAIVGAILVLAVAVFRLHLVALLAGLLLTQLGMVAYWLVRSLSANA